MLCSVEYLLYILRITRWRFGSFEEIVKSHLDEGLRKSEVHDVRVEDIDLCEWRYTLTDLVKLIFEIS